MIRMNQNDQNSSVSTGCLALSLVLLRDYILVRLVSPWNKYTPGFLNCASTSDIVVAMRSRKQTHSEGQCR